MNFFRVGRNPCFPWILSNAKLASQIGTVSHWTVQVRYDTWLLFYVNFIYYLHSGVNPYKAGKFRAEESSGEKPSQQPDNRYDIFDNGNSSGETNKWVRIVSFEMQC